MTAPLAALDIGTNTLLLLVVERDGDDLRAVHEDCRFGRLGQGLDASGRLAGEAIARSLDIVRVYRAEMDRRGVARVAAVGTQALREAANAAAFLGPARDILGVDIEVISGDREAELVYSAAARAFPALAGADTIVADVGGGSTEVIVGRAGAVRWRRSLPIGSVRLAERHLHSDPPRADEARAMIDDIDRVLADLDLPSGAPVIGVAGTATTLAALEQHLLEYDPDRIQGMHLGLATIERQLARLLELTVSERRELRGLEPERADVIPAGAAIFARLLRRADSETLVVNDRGVRWGVAWELAAR
jgi:exopolyphosphatase/guanosine-5'-triphosphate,3'-diphosphate pyrophosphatase